MGARTGNLLGRKRRSSNGRRRGESYQFICYLDRLPPHLPELDESFRQVNSASAQVACELEAEDFAGAVADAIRTLEDEFTHVIGVERLS